MKCNTIALNSQIRSSDNSMQFGYVEQCHLMVGLTFLKAIIKYEFNNYQYCISSACSDSCINEVRNVVFAA